MLIGLELSHAWKNMCYKEIKLPLSLATVTERRKAEGHDDSDSANLFVLASIVTGIEEREQKNGVVEAKKT